MGENEGHSSHIYTIGQVVEKDEALPITFAMRAYMSTHHLWAAKHFSNLALEIEKKCTKSPVFKQEHRAYATNSIFSIVAFLEACINELYQDALDEHLSYLEKIPENKIKNLATYWKQTNENGRWPSFFKKYDSALKILDCPPFVKVSPTFQNIELVNKLRVALVHYAPSTLSKNSSHDLTQKLQRKFKENQLLKGSDNPWFPGKCLGHGCSDWAIQSVTKFTDEFFEKIDVVPNYKWVLQ